MPTFFINDRGYPKDWAEFRAETHEWCRDANLQSYYPTPAMEESLAATAFSRPRRYESGSGRYVLQPRNVGKRHVEPAHLVVNYKY